MGERVTRTVCPRPPGGQDCPCASRYRFWRWISSVLTGCLAVAVYLIFASRRNVEVRPETGPAVVVAESPVLTRPGEDGSIVQRIRNQGEGDPYALKNAKEPFSVVGANMRVTDACRRHFEMTTEQFQATGVAIEEWMNLLKSAAADSIETVDGAEGVDTFRVRPYPEAAATAEQRLSETLSSILGIDKSKAFMEGITCMTAFGCLGKNEVIVEFRDESITGNSPHIVGVVKEYDAATGRFLQGMSGGPNAISTELGIPFHVTGEGVSK